MPKLTFKSQNHLIESDPPQEIRELALKGFIDATPKDHFNVIDMGYSGRCEWQKWDDASFFGAKFIVR